MTKTDEAVKAEDKVENTSSKSSKKKSDNKKSAKGSTKKTTKDTAKKTGSKKSAKGSTKKAAAKPKKEKAALDKYGFREGTKKSEAAALYAEGNGATLGEVKKATGSSQLNLIKEVQKKGFKVTTKKEKGDAGKQVTRYKIGGKSSDGAKKKKK